MKEYSEPINDKTKHSSEFITMSTTKHVYGAATNTPTFINLNVAGL